VPLLLRPGGYFFNMDEFPAAHTPSLLKQVEIEARTQIEAVLATGLQPDHLDWHSLRMNLHQDVYDVLLSLALEYHLPLRVIGEEMGQKVRALGLPGNDREFLDSWMIPPSDKLSAFERMLHELPAGLSEWAIHPGFDCPELHDFEPTGQGFRQVDFDFWTSPRPQEIIEREGIILVDYSMLKPLWNNKKKNSL
jgi:predicted glycoside hydrolase/deacetylase ChbG (UPF0249 family)